MRYGGPARRQHQGALGQEHRKKISKPNETTGLTEQHNIQMITNTVAICY